MTPTKEGCYYALLSSGDPMVPVFVPDPNDQGDAAKLMRATHAWVLEWGPRIPSPAL